MTRHRWVHKGNMLTIYNGISFGVKENKPKPFLRNEGRSYFAKSASPRKSGITHFLSTVALKTSLQTKIRMSREKD